MTNHPRHVLIIGAGAAGLMAGRELARAGTQVTILEARDRCGGRIFSLPAAEFGYRADGGAEFVHGEAAVTTQLAREAGLTLAPLAGTRWSVENGVLVPDTPPRHADEVRHALEQLHDDIPVAEFLERYFAGPEYTELRQSIEQMVEGYDAADPRRASTFAIRDEWMGGDGPHRSQRIVEGYGALIDFLAAECRRYGVQIRLAAPVRAIETIGAQVVARSSADQIEGDAVLVTLPLPLLSTIELPPRAREKAALAIASIGYGNVVKFLLHFRSRWWAEGGRDDDLSFVFSETTVPVWWTQYPARRPVLTGWLGGPKSERVKDLSPDQLLETGIDSLAETFRRPVTELKRDLVAARALDWGADPFARGAYSYPTISTARIKPLFRQADGDNILFCGEAFYVGREAATVEAALASARETARLLLRSRS
jgi:monoamine oxidase